MKKLPIPIPGVIRKNSVPVSLRTKRDEINYAKANQKKTTNALLDEPRIKEWKLWALIDNDFPYSAAFKVHHMLIPKRITSDKELTPHERKELDKILDDLSDQYDCLLINFKSKQSIRNHFHIHLLTYKDKRKELKI